MTAVPGRLTAFLTEANDCPTNPPTYVAARALAANVAETISVPAGASFVQLAGNVDFYISYTVQGGSLVAAIVPIDDDVGGSNELIKQQGSPVWRWLPSGITALSIITANAGGGIVTASFYTV